MRRLIFPLLGVVAVVALSAIPVASASKSHAVKKCGTLYTPPCKKPTIAVASKVTCAHTGTVLKFPIHVKGNAGLRKVTVKVGGKTIKVVTFKGGPTNKTITVAVSTRGSKAGLFTLTVITTDVRGKSVSKNAHFTICKPKPPVFTG